MALSNAQRQARHREKLKTGQLVRIEARVAPDTAATLDRLAALWVCSKTEALGRALFNAWRQAEESLPDHEPAGLEPSGISPAPQRGPGAQTIAQWKRGAEKRVINGLTAIMEHFSQHSRYEGMTYAGIRDLLSETDYQIACKVEIRLMQTQGLSWTAMARDLNEKGVPVPAGAGWGKWTGPKVRALMQE